MADYFEKIREINWKQTDRLAPEVLVLIILYLCWKLAALFWLLIAPPQAMQLDRVELGSQQTQVPNISSFALFQENRSSAADAQLNMVLQGVVVGQPSRYSSAVIKVNESSDRYLVGETIQGSSYQLAEVYWDKVILTQGNGARRELAFQGIENGLDQPIVPTANATSGGSLQNNSMQNAANPANSGQGTTQSAIGQAVQRMTENREQYLQEMGVNPSGNGGFEISNRTPAALRNKLGLQPGDRIMSLNGQAVGAGQSEAQLLEQARREGQVKLEVKRGDQVMTIQQDF